MEREAKQRAKRDQLEAARVEVDEAERKLSELLSVHKNCAPKVDWIAETAALCPAQTNAFVSGDRRDWRRKRVQLPLEDVGSAPPLGREELGDSAAKAHTDALRTWERNRALGKRLLAGVESAFVEALAEFSYLEAVAQLGATIDVTVHTAKGVEIDVRCNDVAVVPAVMKTLSSTGKVSEKAIPRAKAQEFYQDHVCSALLRVAREAFAVLPIDLVLLHGRALVHNSATGADNLKAIYSVFIPRVEFKTLDFERLDPSDAIESFPHRGDFKGSRKAGAFQPIKPFSFNDAPAFVSVTDANSTSLTELLRQLRTAKESLAHSLEV